MGQDYTLLSTIIADDIRREDSGKDIVIGVFNEALIVGEVPTMLATFAVRFSLRSKKEKYNIVIVTINSPDGNEVVRFTGAVLFEDIKYMSSFFYKCSPFPLQCAGKYEIYLDMDGSKELASTFEVVLKQLEAQPS